MKHDQQIMLCNVFVEIKWNIFFSNYSWMESLFKSSLQSGWLALFNWFIWSDWMSNKRKRVEKSIFKKILIKQALNFIKNSEILLSNSIFNRYWVVFKLTENSYHLINTFHRRTVHVFWLFYSNKYFMFILF